MGTADRDLEYSYASNGVPDHVAINKLFGAINANPNNNARVADFINATSRGFQGHGNLELDVTGTGDIRLTFSVVQKTRATYYYMLNMQIILIRPNILLLNPP